MNTDLEDRLHRYGALLDDATRAGASVRAELPARDRDVPIAPLVARRTPSSLRRRVALAAAVLCAVVVTALAVVARDRVSGPADDGRSQFWPVVLDRDVVPWYELSSGLPRDASGPSTGPAQGALYCSTWTVASTSIACHALEGESFLPELEYRGRSGWRLDVYSRWNSDPPATYAAELSQGNVGYDHAPLRQLDVSVAGHAARLVEFRARRIVTWRAAPNLLVAVESDRLTREQLVRAASGAAPAHPDVAALPLVAARGSDPSYGGAPLAIGRVRDGQLCLLEGAEYAPGLVPTGSQVAHAHCRGLSPRSLATILYSDAGGTVGLVASDVASVELAFHGGTSIRVQLGVVAIGDARAFAELRSDHQPWNPGTLLLFDGQGRELGRIRLSTRAVSSTTTASYPASGP